MFYVCFTMIGFHSFKYDWFSLTTSLITVLVSLQLELNRLPIELSHHSITSKIGKFLKLRVKTDSYFVAGFASGRFPQAAGRTSLTYNTFFAFALCCTFISILPLLRPVMQSGLRSACCGQCYGQCCSQAYFSPCLRQTMNRPLLLSAHFCLLGKQLN